jgi:ATP-dependent protease ClpP protease subunit
VTVYAEAEYAAAKSRWRGQHHWREPPPTIHLTLSGEIEDSAINDLILAMRQNDLAPIYLEIDSLGGDPASGLRAYHGLRGHAAPVHVHAVRRCSSAAILPLLGGDVRSAALSTKFLLHTAEFAIARVGRNNAASLRQSAAALDMMDQDMAAIIGLRTRYPYWQLADDMESETILDAYQAHLFGLLTEPPK